MARRRLPLWPVILATALALVAASSVFLVLGGRDDGDAAGADGDDEFELAPTGELPTSPAEVTLGALDGGPDRRLGELLGQRPVVVNFFASWCLPCREEMPAFERVHQDLRDQVTIVGLATRDRPQDAQAIVDDTGVTYPTFIDAESSAITYFGGMAMPTTVFIDRSGQVVEVTSEALSEEALRQRLADHFGVDA